MEDTITTQGDEAKAPEGTVAAEVAKVEVPEVKSDKAPETVPLAVFLDLKKDLKDLKSELENAKSSEKSSVQAEGFADLASKYPDVSSDFIKDMLGAATLEAQKKIEQKYNPIIEKQEQKEKQIAFDTAFNNLFEKTLQDNPDLPKTIDKELVKELALTPKYINVPLSDILIKMYGSNNTGKSSSENETRTGADIVEDVVDFNKITSEQKTAILADEKTRVKYFNWLDTQVGR
jgi:hypothetical protein